MKIENFNFAGHKAIVRVDFNVPLDANGNVTDDTRIRGALPTLKKILSDGGALIMMSHMGKPKGKVKPELSLSQIVKNVSAALGVEVKFAKDAGNAEAEASSLKGGEALLLENLRYYAEEEGKPVGVEKGTPEYDAAKAEMKNRQKDFAKKLASYADVYVNDAFGTAHRKHASTAVIADYFDADHKMLGLLMEKEVKAIDNVLKNAEHPFTAIIGGSKVSSKLAVIKNLLDKVDNLIIGGGMGYTFIKAQGGKIGNSLHEDDLMPEASMLLRPQRKRALTSRFRWPRWLATSSLTTLIAKRSTSTTFPTAGRVWTPRNSRLRTGRRLSCRRKPSYGTVRLAYLNSRISRAARATSPKP